ncbi:unnamed protein product [Cuscuta campestris]|uniref:Uncharacterized protein n=1 Tax=Cuscuta campestris TaxID=132261 RepID=A0A484N374_9ASTE|nr:unnamed protein product [Cuscuta campestris]
MKLTVKSSLPDFQKRMKAELTNHMEIIEEFRRNSPFGAFLDIQRVPPPTMLWQFMSVRSILLLDGSEIHAPWITSLTSLACVANSTLGALVREHQSGDKPVQICVRKDAPSESEDEDATRKTLTSEEVVHSASHEDDEGKVDGDDDKEEMKEEDDDKEQEGVKEDHDDEGMKEEKDEFGEKKFDPSGVSEEEVLEEEAMDASPLNIRSTVDQEVLGEEKMVVSQLNLLNVRLMWIRRRRSHDIGDPLVIKVEINNVVVHCTLVDTGSSVNIMYNNTFKELGLSRGDLKPIRTPLSGFTGDTIEAEGTITVRARVGDGTHRLWLDMEFMGDQEPNTVDENVSTICAAIQKEEGRPRAEPVEEVEELALDPAKSEQKVKAGKTLPPRLKEQLMGVLRSFKVLFAWGLEDMPGVDPRIICHRLAVDPAHKPVKQKKHFL